MATWNPQLRSHAGYIDVFGFATKGLFDTPRVSRTEESQSSWMEGPVFIRARGSLGTMMDGIGLWSGVSKQTSTWTGVVQSGTVAAQFELNEPLGGPVWTPVDKDT